MNKTAKVNGMFFVGLAAVVFLGLIALSFMGINPLSTGDSDLPTTGPGGAVIIDDVNSITATYYDEDAYKGTNNPNSNLEIFSPKLDGPSDGNAVTLSKDTVYKAIAGNASATYYGQEISINSKDARGDQLRVDVELCLAGAPTVTIKNVDDSVNSNTNAQAMAADDVYELELKIDTPSNKCFGSPDADNKNVVVIEFDGTYIDSVEIDGATKASEPKIYTSTNATFDETDVFYLPSLVDGDDGVYTIIVDTDSSQNPVPAAGEINLKIFDANLRYDYEAKEVIRAVEDQNDAAIGIVPVNTTLHLS